MLKAAQTSLRHDAVWLRVSTVIQELKPQRDNVLSLLNELGVAVPTEYWFECKVPRDGVSGNAAFNQLISLVKQDRIGTVYIEAQDRFGTDNLKELVPYLTLFQEHGTALYDLTQKIDLTSDDRAVETKVVGGTHTSSESREAMARQAVRNKMNHFKATGSWPTGAAPFGYGKANYSPEGKLLWEWYPNERLYGDTYFPNEHGKLILGQRNVKITPKVKTDVRKLIRHRNAEFVDTVQLIFDWYTRLGLAFNRIADRLNALGRRHYTKLWTHTLVKGVLENPDYIGDTHFGKTLTAKFYTMGTDGTPKRRERTPGKPRKLPPQKRAVEKRLVMTGTHEALITKEQWALAQARLAASPPPSARYSGYYLRPLLVCGHCNKVMQGRIEGGQPGYICPTYNNKRKGQPCSCGFHFIAHDVAEKLLLDKMAETDVKLGSLLGNRDAGQLEQRLLELDQQESAYDIRWGELVTGGVDAFAQYLNENHDLPTDVFVGLRRQTLRIMMDLKDKTVPASLTRRLPKDLVDLSAAIKAAEAKGIEQARKKVAKLTEDHHKYTKRIVEDDITERQRQVCKAEAAALELQIEQWTDRTVSVSDRLTALYKQEETARAQRKKLMADYPELERREKGETLRRLFNPIKLFWTRTFHAPSPKTRHRKTSRKGRYSYALDLDRIEITLARSDASPDLVGSL